MRIRGSAGDGGLTPPKRVTKTGLAVVHENELVYPAVGSAAEAVAASQDSRATIQMVFPVTVEVVSPGDPGESERVAGEALRLAAQRLRRLT